MAHKFYTKKNLTVAKIRRFLEPGPIVLVSSAYKGETNIMAMGWHMVMEFEPSRVGCFITGANHSFGLIQKSKECVINIPEIHLIDMAIAIGNSHGGKFDKFAEFDLTPQKASTINAPLIKECYANFECRLTDTSLISKYNLFIFEVVKAHAAISPKYPKTFHYRGDGVFMISGENRNYRRKFKPENL
jgi:flavin reductase (DIM6/NTAB) family NADH-FMN oxidoreductase RutF